MASFSCPTRFDDTQQATGFEYLNADSALGFGVSNRRRRNHDIRYRRECRTIQFHGETFRVLRSIETAAGKAFVIERPQPMYEKVATNKYVRRNEMVVFLSDATVLNGDAESLWKEMLLREGAEIDSPSPRT